MNFNYSRTRFIERRGSFLLSRAGVVLADLASRNSVALSREIGAFVAAAAYVWLARRRGLIQSAGTVLAVSFISTGCVSTGATSERVEVADTTPDIIKRQIALVDSDLDVTAKLSAAGIVMNRPGHLVALIEKASGSVSYNYIAQLVYSDERWRFYDTANSSVRDSPRQSAAQVLSRNVAGCSRGARIYTCTYDERVSVALDGDTMNWISSLYRPGEDVRWRLRFNGTGEPIIHELLPQEAVALQAAVSEYLTRLKSGFMPVQRQ